MITAVAFTCVSADGATVSRVEFTPELKATFGLSGLGSLIKQPLDYAAIEKAEPAAIGPAASQPPTHDGRPHSATAAYS
jgi:hypothetical protein